MHCSNVAGVLLGLFALAVVPGAAAQYGGAPDTGTVRCESRDGRLRECPVDVSGGVRLVKQLSRADCERGRSWGVSRDGVWVSDGCRAAFAYGYGAGDDGGAAPGSRDRTLRCESKNGRWKHCSTSAEGAHIEFVRQLSRGHCLRNQTWGVDARGVWVSGGCRADFRLVTAEEAPRRDDTKLVRCESIDGRREHCPISTRGGVRMARQLSRTNCVEGHNWRFDRNGIWVEEGCRADFEIGRRSAQDSELGRND